MGANFINVCGNGKARVSSVTLKGDVHLPGSELQNTGIRSLNSIHHLRESRIPQF